jgi:serine/threonine-protein kinase
MQDDVDTLALSEDEQTRRAKARVGQTLRGRWSLDSLLGMGGMAAVYAATHRNGKRVAVKVLHPELSANPEMKQRFIDEAYAANRVGHPAAVSVLDDDVTEDGSAFLVMDLLEGETLDARIRRRGKMDPAEILLVTDVLLDVLAAAHDKGIVHRDVKPDNVFITTEGKVKLLDFGIARLTTPGRPRTTQSGATMGTPAYMPPEQARGHWEQIDGRTDLWAVGATMFVALTGRQVHEGDTPNEELLSAMTQRAPSLAALAPALRPSIVDLVDRALAFEQHDRWSHAREMQAALRVVQALMDEDGSFTGDPHDLLRHSVHPVDSARPVTLLTPHPMVASSSQTVPPPTVATKKKPLIAGIAAAALLLIALATGLSNKKETAAPTTGSVTLATVAAPVLAPEPVASSAPAAIAPATTPIVEEEPTAPGKLKNDKPRAPKPHTSSTPKSTPPVLPVAAAAVTAPVAPAAPPQLPSTPDPLDRRK